MIGKPANIQPLVGRTYVTKSGLRCTFKRLGDGALRVNWDSVKIEKMKGAVLVRPVKEPSKADRDEVNQWIGEVLKSEGIELDIEVCEDQKEEAARYAAWKKTLEGG